MVVSHVSCWNVSWSIVIGSVCVLVSHVGEGGGVSGGGCMSLWRVSFSSVSCKYKVQSVFGDCECKVLSGLYLSGSLGRIRLRSEVIRLSI